MGSKQLEALVEVLQHQLGEGHEGFIAGTWTMRYDMGRQAFTFDKCENEGYCEERPSVIALDGTVIDEGGPLLG